MISQSDNVIKLNSINRIFYNFKNKEDGSIRMDRNEKVEDWNDVHFNKILNNIKSYEITGYPSNNFDNLYLKYSKYLNVSKNNIYYDKNVNKRNNNFNINKNNTINKGNNGSTRPNKTRINQKKKR